MRAETLLAVDAPRGISLPMMPRGGIPWWTVAESAMATFGVSRRNYVAARYTYALDDSVYYENKLNLLEFCFAERERAPVKWPKWVIDYSGMRYKYLQTLVGMHLCEERIGQHFHFPRRYSEYLWVSERIWLKRLAPLYEVIRCEWVNWQACCFASMQRKINED